MNRESIRLLARADDFGSFHAANRGIHDSFTKGIVRNVSTMVTAQCFDEAAEMLRGHPEICVGVHGTIACEWNEQRWKPVLPAEQVPTLIEADGCFGRTIDRVHKAGVRFAEIVAELQAQVERARGRGLDVKYVDNHMAFGWLFEGTDDSRRLDDVMVEWTAREGMKWHGWGNKLGLSWLDLGKPARSDRPAAFARALRAAAPGTYCMITHPSYAEGDIMAATYGSEKPGAVAEERNDDRRVFMEQDVLDAVREKEVELIRYDAL